MSGHPSWIVAAVCCLALAACKSPKKNAGSSAGPPPPPFGGNYAGGGGDDERRHPPRSHLKGFKPAATNAPEEKPAAAVVPPPSVVYVPINVTNTETITVTNTLTNTVTNIVTQTGDAKLDPVAAETANADGSNPGYIARRPTERTAPNLPLPELAAPSQRAAASPPVLPLALSGSTNPAVKANHPPLALSLPDAPATAHETDASRLHIWNGIGPGSQLPDRQPRTQQLSLSATLKPDRTAATRAPLTLDLASGTNRLSANPAAEPLRFPDHGPYAANWREQQIARETAVQKDREEEWNSLRRILYEWLKPPAAD